MTRDLTTSATTKGAPRCARHPAVETRLGCTECGRAICPRCMVPYETGYKCPDCAGRHVSHMYHTSTRQQVLLGGLSLAAGFGYGYIHPWLLSIGFLSFFGIPLTAFLLAYGLGRLVGNGIQRWIGPKQGSRVTGLLSGFALLGLLLGPFGPVVQEAAVYLLTLHAAGFSLVYTTAMLMQLIAPLLFIRGMRRAFYWR